jgi:hypothetical protein
MWKKNRGGGMRNKSDEKHIEFLRTQIYPWCSDDQWECCKMIFDLVGENHLYNPIKAYGSGICYNTAEDFATFDFNLMTIAVFMAHDRCIRIAIQYSTRKMIKLCLWKRHGRDGNISLIHPSLETALAEYRKYYPLCDKEMNEANNGK